MISAAAQMKYLSTQGLEPDVAALESKSNRIFSPAVLLRPFTTLSALSCNKLMCFGSDAASFTVKVNSIQSSSSHSLMKPPSHAGPSIGFAQSKISSSSPHQKSHILIFGPRFYFCKKRRNLWNCQAFRKCWFWRMAMMSPIWEVGGDPLKIYSFQPSVRSPLTFHQRTIKKTVICCPSVKTAGWRSLVLTLFSQQFLKLGEDDVKLRNCTSCPMPPSRSTFFFFKERVSTLLS